MSLGTSNRDGGKTSESGHLRALAKIVSGDVIEGLNAVQRAAGVNMSVDVQIGDAFVRRSDGSYAHPVFNDAVYNQVISAADGSNPRRDIVVIYVDYGQTPSTAVSNNTNGVVKIKVVNGTPAGSPVDPNGAAIQASVGSGNPYTILARVRVPAGQTSISNSLIDDLRTMITSNATTINTAAIIDAAVTTAKILDANVTNAKLATGAGEAGGAWTSWTPTFANFTKGSATVVAKYTQIGKTVHFYLAITLSGSTMGSGPTFTLPVTAVTYPGPGVTQNIGISSYIDTGTAQYRGEVVIASTTTATLQNLTAASTHVGPGLVTSTLPHTWANTDFIYAQGTYEAA